MGHTNKKQQPCMTWITSVHEQHPSLIIVTYKPNLIKEMFVPEISAASRYKNIDPNYEAAQNLEKIKRVIVLFPAAVPVLEHFVHFSV